MPAQPFAVYLAPRGFEQDLIAELGDRVLETRGRLVLASGAPTAAAWAQNVWRNPEWISVASIGDAARKLKGLQRNWALHAVDHHRRATLIQEQLPKVAARPLSFGEASEPAGPGRRQTARIPALPEAPLGGWTLWEPGLALAATDTSSPFPDGEARD